MDEKNLNKKSFGEEELEINKIKKKKKKKKKEERKNK